MIYNGDIKELDRYHELISIPELKLGTGEFIPKEYLKQYISDNYFLTYKEDDIVKGLIFGEKLKADGAIIWMIAVDEKYRNQGIGKKLISEFENRVRKNDGIKWIITYGYNKENVLNFYTGNGYEKGVETVEFEKAWY